MKDKYYENIKESLINNEIVKRVKDYSKNKSDLETYYKVGKLLSEAGKHYGEGIIKKYSIELKKDVNTKYSERMLRKYRQFYIRSSSNEIWPTLSAKLTWSHIVELLLIDDIDKINYYSNKVYNNNLTVRELRSAIKSKEYERLPEKPRNKLANSNISSINKLIPEPIIIKTNLNDRDSISEKALNKLIVENISEFMKQIGDGYSFIESEYRIKIGDCYSYIDLLLFNIKYNCYVVIELKATELKKEHIGQIQVYMNYIDQNIKTIYQEKTIGIILVKRNNEFIIEYSSDDRIISRMYLIINN